MKKLIFVLLLMVIILSSCSKESELELEDFAEAYIAEGYVVDLEEKPFYSFVGAIDGFIFYIGNQKVAVYEFASTKALNNSDFDFDATYGRFGLETDSEIAKTIFSNVE